MNYLKKILVLKAFCLISLVYFSKISISNLLMQINLLAKIDEIIIIEPNVTLPESGLSYIPRKNKFTIYLIWFGSSLPDIYLKCLQTVVYHHPKADVLLFSNDLNESLLDPFRKKNFTNVHIVRFNLTKLGQNEPGNQFILKANEILNGKNDQWLQLTRVHMSDFMRYFLVYKYGGFYIDTDSFVIKNLENLKNSIGVTDNFGFKCSNKVFNAPKAKNFTCISNSVYHFDRHHPFMKDCLENYETWWTENQGYAPAGATMMMELIESNFDEIKFIPQRELFCFNHLDKTRKIVIADDEDLTDALNNCYTIQMLAAGSSTLELENFDETFVGRIFDKFKIF